MASGSIALTSGSAAIGTVALTSGAATIGKVQLTSGSAALAIGSVTVSSDPALHCSTDNVGAALDINKVMHDNTALTVSHAVIDCGTSENNTLIAAAGSTKYIIHSMALHSASNTIVSLFFRTGTTGTGIYGTSNRMIALELDGGAAPAGVVLPFNPHGWFRTSTDNKTLSVWLSTAQDITGCLTYSAIVSGA